MAWTNKPHTMAIAYAHICAGEEPWIALGNFTNDFFHVKNRVCLLRDPLHELPMIPEIPAPGSEEGPTHSSSQENVHRWAVFCAVATEYLCQKYELVVPSWVFDPQFARLPEPWYHLPVASAKKPQVRERLEQETPQAFKARNIFCGDRIFLDKRAEAEKLRRMIEA